MVTLNLVYPKQSDIKYKISQFPDGQQQVQIDLQKELKLADEIYKWTIPVLIKSRLNNFKDLELIICTVASLRELGVKNIELYVPYFLGSRSDRKFEKGSNNYLKTVICPIINSLNFDKVTVLDPHSDVLEACLNNFNKVDNSELVKHVLYNEICAGPGFVDTEKLDNTIIISPDAGANKKIFKLAEEIGYKREIITCSKSRDIDGKLSNTIVPLNNINITVGENKDYIIVDDICDGGRTFINIAKSIDEYYRDNFSNTPFKIYLIVTHGIFSAGYKELMKYFDAIYCTNSYKDVGTHANNGLGDVYKHNIKQLNIF